MVFSDRSAREISLTADDGLNHVEQNIQAID
jgi:hypothetical protein